MRTLSIFLAVSVLCARPISGRDSASQNTPPRASQADRPLPYDSHDGITLSADAYTNPGRTKEKFGKANPLPAGILPVEVFIRNDTAQAVRIDLSTVQLDVRLASGESQDIDSLDVSDVASAIAHPGGSPPRTPPRFPIGMHSSLDTKTDKLADMLRPLALDADVAPPMATIHGFLFFEVGHDTSLARNSSLYLPDVVILPSNKPLMFFEVSLGDAQQP